MEDAATWSLCPMARSRSSSGNFSCLRIGEQVNVDAVMAGDTRKGIAAALCQHVYFETRLHTHSA